MLNSISNFLSANHGINIESVLLIGGKVGTPRIKSNNLVNPQVVVATPGKMKEELLFLKRYRYRYLQHLVFDEADRLVFGDLY